MVTLHCRSSLQVVPILLAIVKIDPPRTIQDIVKLSNFTWRIKKTYICSCRQELVHTDGVEGQGRVA